MKAVFNRGNLILGVSWALAVGMFLNRAGKMDAHSGAGVGKMPQAHAAPVTGTAPAAAAGVDAAPVEVPVIADPVGDALSRNDAVRPLP
jgi:hypothetical protein